jgi:pimeloyl-ACP methyl ester carboxylesterase
MQLHWERFDRGGDAGGREPLLWITGFTISSAVFEPVLPLYAKRFDSITYDNRGSGRSPAPMAPTSMPELAADAVRVLDAAGIESAHVYGLSMGGMIAQELAIRFPDRVRGLILGGTTPGGPLATRPRLRELGALGGGAVRGLGEPGRPVLARMLFSEEFRAAEPERVRELLRYFGAHRARPHGMAGHLWASIYHDTVSRLPKIQAPTLVMHGGADTMAPVANAHLLARRIPDATLRIVEGTGHAYLLEAPERSLALLLDWLDSRPVPIGPGRAHTGLAARTEPFTRALGLPGGALRTGRSLAVLGARRLRAPDRGRRTPSG